MSLLLASQLLVLGGPAAAPGSIVMFVADDLGWNDLQFRNPLMRTPVIDALRLRGVSLTNYYVQPVCSPTRGSLLAAKFPMHLGYDGVLIIFNTGFRNRVTRATQNRRQN